MKGLHLLYSAIFALFLVIGCGEYIEIVDGGGIEVVAGEVILEDGSPADSAELYLNEYLEINAATSVSALHKSTKLSVDIRNADQPFYTDLLGKFVLEYLSKKKYVLEISHRSGFSYFEVIDFTSGNGITLKTTLQKPLILDGYLDSLLYPQADSLEYLVILGGTRYGSSVDSNGYFRIDSVPASSDSLPLIILINEEQDEIIFDKVPLLEDKKVTLDFANPEQTRIQNLADTTGTGISDQTDLSSSSLDTTQITDSTSSSIADSISSSELLSSALEDSLSSSSADSLSSGGDTLSSAFDSLSSAMDSLSSSFDTIISSSDILSSAEDSLSSVADTILSSSSEGPSSAMDSVSSSIEESSSSEVLSSSSAIELEECARFGAILYRENDRLRIYVLDPDSAALDTFQITYNDSTMNTEQRHGYRYVDFDAVNIPMGLLITFNSGFASDSTIPLENETRVAENGSCASLPSEFTADIDKLSQVVVGTIILHMDFETPPDDTSGIFPNLVGGDSLEGYVHISAGDDTTVNVLNNDSLGQFDQGLYLDTNHNGIVKGFPGTMLSNGQFTVSFWLKTSQEWSGDGDYKTILRCTEPATRFPLNISVLKGTINWSGNMNEGKHPTRVDDGQWHHIAIVGNGSNIVLIFVDGISASTGLALLDTGFDFGGDMLLGQRVHDTSPLQFEGIIDELVFDTTPWNQTRVQNYYQNPEKYIFQGIP